MRRTYPAGYKVSVCVEVLSGQPVATVSLTPGALEAREILEGVVPWDLLRDVEAITFATLHELSRVQHNPEPF